MKYTNTRKHKYIFFNKPKKNSCIPKGGLKT